MIQTKAPLLIDRVDAEVRNLLIDCRATAMQGGFANAIATLDREIAIRSKGSPDPKVVALALLKAELLYLNFQDKDCLEVFDIAILPYSRDFEQNERFVIELNRIEPKRSLFSPGFTLDYYNLVDRQKLVGFEFLEFQEFVAADEAASDDKHFDALPTLWRELHRTYRQGCWFAFRWASRRFAVECMKLGAVAEAAYHAAVSQDTGLAGPISEQLVASRQSGLVEETLNTLLSLANLGRHFEVACEIISRISDSIPDHLADRVANWLITRSSEHCLRRPGSSFESHVWHAIKPLGRRLSESVVIGLVHRATSDPSWVAVPSDPNKVIVGRKPLIELANAIVDSLPDGYLETLARQSLPLAMDRMQSYDLPNAIALLGHLYVKGGEKVKRIIGDTLYAPDGPKTLIHARAAKLVFDRVFYNPEETDRLALLAAANVRRTVQRLASDEAPAPVNFSLMTFTAHENDRKVVITTFNGLDLLTLVDYREQLKADTTRVLCDACLDLANDADNLLSNRSYLVHIIGGLASAIPSKAARRYFDAVLRLARGEITVAPRYEHGTYQGNPLNRAKINIGTTAELKRTALITLSQLATAKPLFKKQLMPLLVDAMGDPDSSVRGGAFLAARLLPAVPKSMLGIVLMGTRDAVSDVAAEAFGVLSKNPPATLEQWTNFEYSVQMVSQSPSPRLRKYVALSLTKLRNRAEPLPKRAALEPLIALFQNDPLCNVRNALKEGDAAS